MSKRQLPFIAKFWGREKGDIFTSSFQLIVYGADKKEAHLNLYETHDHVQHLLLTPMRKGQDNGN